MLKCLKPDLSFKTGSYIYKLQEILWKFQISRFNDLLVTLVQTKLVLSTIQ